MTLELMCCIMLSGLIVHSDVLCWHMLHLSIIKNLHQAVCERSAGVPFKLNTYVCMYRHPSNKSCPPRSDKSPLLKRLKSWTSVPWNIKMVSLMIYGALLKNSHCFLHSPPHSLQKKRQKKWEKMLRVKQDKCA